MTLFNDYHNPQVKNMPVYLRQFIIEQQYEYYTPADHALWRYLMRQNGLNHPNNSVAEATGLSIEQIPELQKMNDALSKISWGVVAVSDLIPPSVFMEFLSHRVLPVSAAIRSLSHIEQSYTPDILHAAALSALLFADPEYLYHLGQLGSRAIYSVKDLQLQKAVYDLLLLKKAEEPDPAATRKAEKLVDFCQKNSAESSEMALLYRLYQWTAEYGLTGTPETLKPYGAAFHSSLKEHRHLQHPEIKKYSYAIDAINYPLSITGRQEQYFVSDDFQSMSRVLKEFADRMAYLCGGTEGILKAIESKSTCTAVYSSGLQVSGVFCDLRMDVQDNLQFIKTTGPTALSFGNKQLENQGKHDHSDGFSSPVGRIKNLDKALEDASSEELEELGIVPGNQPVIHFESGLILSGTVLSILSRESKIILISFSEASLKDETGNIYFKPSWGKFDMAVGEKIVSVYAGAADKKTFDEIQSASACGITPPACDKKTQQYRELFSIVRNCRKTGSGYERLPKVWHELKTNYREDWLCALEILEIFEKENKNKELAGEIRIYLELKASNEAELNQLIRNGLRLSGQHQSQLN
ncbi:aromatic amino acid hydroxylase [Daejeonella sp. H1SJ63]|uniref:aromatic amino acid hydroxylase n=1 Tax=Daejeonella sp. H1SJ63 TaxID=3034145 RepID=UPI0023EE061E|nr:aromatic amino acid hydroxylase [Daejeonella sp. H1SJ63]